MSVRTTRIRGAVACLVALAAVATAGRAAAERQPVVIVDGTSDGAGGDAVRALEAQLAREDALGAVAADVMVALHQPVVAVETWPAEAAAALTEARAALARFGYREAADRAHGALDRLAAVADVPAARKQLAELALVEGQALVGAGALAQAELTLRLVHRLDPGRTLDPSRYLPEVVSAYLLAGRPSSPTGTLHLAAPGAAEVLVDGVVVGSEPRVIDVAPGPHLIAARGEAIDTTGRRIDVPAGPIRVDLVPLLAPLPVRVTRVVNRLRAASNDAAVAAAMRTLVVDLAQARDAIVVVHGATGLATRIYTTAGGLGPEQPLTDADLVIAPLRPLVITPPPPPPPRPLPDEPWYRTRRGRTIIGVSVGAVLAGIVTAMVLRDEGSSTFIGKPEVD